MDKMVQLRSVNESAAPQITIRQEHQTKSFSAIRTELKDDSSGATGMQTKHPMFIHLFENKAARAIATGLLVSVMLVTMAEPLVVVPAKENVPVGVTEVTLILSESVAGCGMTLQNPAVPGPMTLNPGRDLARYQLPALTPHMSP